MHRCTVANAFLRRTGSSVEEVTLENHKTGRYLTWVPALEQIEQTTSDWGWPFTPTLMDPRLAAC